MATTEQATRSFAEAGRTDSSSSFASVPPLSINDDEVNSVLKNVGSRVRRSVSQGYATHDPRTGDGRLLWQKSTSHPTLQFGASAKAPIFISQNDLANEEASKRRPATVNEESEGEPTPRSFAAVQSLPASAFSGAANARAEEEEDWSSSAFTGSFAPAQASA